MSERTSYFSYSASASAFGGVLTKPASLVIPSQAMASLSPSGGHGSASVANFGIPGLLSVASAVTTVQGDGKRTEVTITLDGVNVMDTLKVDRMVLHLTGEMTPGGREASITPAGSAIEGLSIRGKGLALKSSVDVFHQNPTYSSLERAYAGGHLKGLIIKPGTLGDAPGAPNLDGCASSVGDVRGTIYRLDENLGDWPMLHGGLRVKDLATVYLGEFRISRHARRLTLLRLELGCASEGTLSMGDGAANGHEEPPA